MKPAPQIATITNSRHADVVSRKSFAAPKTDYSYQVGGFGDSSGRCRSDRYHAFRGISEDYFNREARSHFFSEAMMFGLIVVTAAVPVIEGVRGLAQFVYGIL